MSDADNSCRRVTVTQSGFWRGTGRGCGTGTIAVVVLAQKRVPDTPLNDFDLLRNLPQVGCGSTVSPFEFTGRTYLEVARSLGKAAVVEIAGARSRLLCEYEGHASYRIGAATEMPTPTGDPAPVDRLPEK